MTKQVAPFIAALVALAAPSLAQAGTPISLDQVPAAARATIERETRGAQILEIEQDTDGGVLHYEVDFVVNGVRWEIEVAPDGTLLEKELD